jgi:hypothetical protein
MRANIANKSRMKMLQFIQCCDSTTTKNWGREATSYHVKLEHGGVLDQELSRRGNDQTYQANSDEERHKA